jgi:hypothetical protein
MWLIPGSHKKFHTIPEIYPQRLGRVPLMVDHFRFPADDHDACRHASRHVPSGGRRSAPVGFPHHPLQQQHALEPPLGEARADCAR